MKIVLDEASYVRALSVISSNRI